MFIISVNKYDVKAGNKKSLITIKRRVCRSYYSTVFQSKNVNHFVISKENCDLLILLD